MHLPEYWYLGIFTSLTPKGYTNHMILLDVGLDLNKELFHFLITALIRNSRHEHLEVISCSNWLLLLLLFVSLLLLWNDLFLT